MPYKESLDFCMPLLKKTRSNEVVNRSNLKWGWINFLNQRRNTKNLILKRVQQEIKQLVRFDNLVEIALKNSSCKAKYAIVQPRYQYHWKYIQAEVSYVHLLSFNALVLEQYRRIRVITLYTSFFHYSGLNVCSWYLLIFWHALKCRTFFAFPLNIR